MGMGGKHRRTVVKGRDLKLLPKLESHCKLGIWLRGAPYNSRDLGFKFVVDGADVTVQASQHRGRSKWLPRHFLRGR